MNTLKKTLGLLFFIAITTWFLLDAIDFIELVKKIGIIPRLSIQGYLNNTSSFVLLGFFFPTIPMTFVNIISGLQYPKLTLRLMLFGAVIMALCGHYYDSKLRANLKETNYIECISKRKLTLTYSSRVFVIDPALCERSSLHPIELLNTNVTIIAPEVHQ